MLLKKQRITVYDEGSALADPFLILKSTVQIFNGKMNISQELSCVMDYCKIGKKLLSIIKNKNSFDR